MIPASHDVLSVKFELFKQKVDQIRCVKEVMVLFPEVSFVTCGDASNDDADTLSC